MDMFSELEAWPQSGAKLNVTIVGAGNLGHVLAGQLGARKDVHVSFLSRKADSFRDHAMNEGIKVRQFSADPGQPDQFITGVVDHVSSDPAEVIPSADLIIVTVPSNGRPGVLQSLIPHICPSKPVVLGAMPGMGGFDWIARQLCRRAGLSNVVLFSVKDVPYMATATDPGKSVTNLGPKQALYLAVDGAKDSPQMHTVTHLLTELTHIPVVQLEGFVAITLTPGNPIMHPAIMYGMFGPYSQWDGSPLPEKPLFYEHCSELSAYFLSRADYEVQQIKLAITRRTGIDLTVVWPLRLNIKNVYGHLVADNRTLMQTLRTNRAYATIRTPLKQVEGGFTVDVNHRFFLEDVPFGLVVLRDIADLVDVQVPMIDELIMWCQGLMAKEYLVNGRLVGRDMYMTGAPSQFGVASIEGLVGTYHTQHQSRL